MGTYWASYAIITVCVSWGVIQYRLCISDTEDEYWAPGLHTGIPELYGCMLALYEV
jgi:hypothetical protein